MNNRHKILLVEDDGLLATSLVEDLDYLGYSAKPVNSGEKALAAIKKDPPDLVLMDIKIKGQMDGIETSERINSAYGIPLIYLTAHSDRSFLERAKLTEPYGYLLKPVGRWDLSCAIEMGLYKSLADRKRKKLIPELQKELADLKTLEGVLPLCSFCRQVKDAGGCWGSLEEYLEKHSRARLSHGICPTCLQSYFPDRPKDSGTKAL